MHDDERPILLVVDDERTMRRAVRAVARRHGCHVLEAATGEEGLELLDRYDVTCAFIDHLLPGMLGLDALRRAVSDHPNVGYVLFTSDGDAEIGFEAHKLGADYTIKRAGEAWLLETLHQALNTGKLRRENAELRSDAERSPADRLLLGPSQAMDQLRRQIRTYASISSQHILILGESGVGKEVCAKALHAEAGRPGRLIALNAAGIRPELAASELYGHEKGAFTGADRRKIGAFESASDGMVFLDEIGDLPSEVQTTLFRVIESRTFSRVGSSEPLAFPGRVIGATNQPLDQMIEQGTFRPELRHRFALTIHVPALRDHPEDIPVLAMRFLAEHCVDTRRHIRQISRDAMHTLQSYEWRRNNVRELRNVMLQAVLNARSEIIEVDDLTAEVQAAGRGRPRPATFISSAPSPAPSGGRTRTYEGPELPTALLAMHWKQAKNEALHRFARWYLTHKLAHSEGNVTQAAEGAGVKRPNFHRLMKKHLSDEEIEQAKQCRVAGAAPETESELDDVADSAAK